MGGYHEKVLDYDYWRSTPLINKPRFINPGLKLYKYIYILYDYVCKNNQVTQGNWELYRKQFGHEKEQIWNMMILPQKNTDMRNPCYNLSELSKGPHHPMM